MENRSKRALAWVILATVPTALALAGWHFADPEIVIMIAKIIGAGTVAGAGLFAVIWALAQLVD